MNLSVRKFFSASLGIGKQWRRQQRDNALRNFFANIDGGMEVRARRIGA